MTVIALIVAAGRGSRITSDLPKQYIKFDGSCALTKSIELFAGLVEHIQVVIHPDDVHLYQSATTNYTLLPYCFGGDLRQESVKLGLEAINYLNPTKVLVHDAARPFTEKSVIQNIITALDTKKAVIAASKTIDTIKIVENQLVTRTLDRTLLYNVQTPQGFDYQTILQAHRKCDFAVTDDAAICEAFGIDVYIVESAVDNFKITTNHDVTKLKGEVRMYEHKIGCGFDAHRFATIGDDATTIMLCGVTIPSSKPIEAHSDGDVALHALADALLGCAGAGDIGLHFPPSDMKWKNADSSQFVRHAHQLIKDQQGIIVNVDLTIIAESPRIGAHRIAMQQRVAEILGIAVNRVNIKATTTEKMGFTGRKEGIAVQAVASVRFPLAKNDQV